MPAWKINGVWHDPESVTAMANELEQLRAEMLAMRQVARPICDALARPGNYDLRTVQMERSVWVPFLDMFGEGD